jgi:hypothetical protein
MQQRQLRLGDILDDYCPRERRVTNHAVVAMIGSEVKQTRCSTCDAEHDYKAGKAPSLRKKKDAPATLYGQVLAEAGKNQPGPPPGAKTAAPPAAAAEPVPEPLVASSDQGAEEGPVHRPLIRATLPRTEATMPTRQIPEFTIRQNNGRPGKFRSGAPHRQRPMGGGPGHSGGGPRHAGRSGALDGQGGNRHSSSSHQRPNQHPHGTRPSQPGKKRSR